MMVREWGSQHRDKLIYNLLLNYSNLVLNNLVLKSGRHLKLKCCLNVKITIIIHDTDFNLNNNLPRRFKVGNENKLNGFA